MRLPKAAEQRARQAPLGRGTALHQRRELVVVANEAESARAQQRAEHGGQCELPSLIHQAHIKHPAVHDRLLDPQACARDLRRGRAFRKP